MTAPATHWLDQVVFDANGLVPAIAQDVKTGDVLMVAWMNAEALTKTVADKQAVYWSRSRNRLWHKGEESGHYQQVHDIRLDCDGDVILLKVEQVGGIACHTGRRHCFYRQLSQENEQPRWTNTEPIIKDPKLIYK